MRYQRTRWLPEAWTARPSNNGLKNTLIHAKQRHVCATRRLDACTIHHTARVTQVTLFWPCFPRKSPAARTRCDSQEFALS